MRPLQSWILNVGTPQAVRRIPINTLSLTGEILGQEFESSLERDLLFIMAWDGRLEWFQTQPVRIEYKDAYGKNRSYTPDLLAYFNPRQIIGRPDRKPLLCEVKYRQDLKDNWRELRPKFEAAKVYAKTQGWEFQIFTEDRIRTPLLNNIQYLWSYRFAPSYSDHGERLLSALECMEETTINGLLEACYQPDNRLGRGEGMWALWGLIARETILCDLSIPLSMDTRIWLDPRLC